MKPTLKAPGAKRLKLKYDEPLPNVAFNINLRHYIEEPEPPVADHRAGWALPVPR